MKEDEEGLVDLSETGLKVATVALVFYFPVSKITSATE